MSIPRKFPLFASSSALALLTATSWAQSTPPSRSTQTAKPAHVQGKPTPPLPPPPPSVLLAGGSDDCGSPEPITGQGSFSFSNAAATTTGDGQSQAACDFFGQTDIDHDVWFTWTSPTQGTATITTCGGTGLDTKIAIYLGSGCPAGSPLACNDDFCGVQTSLSLSVFAGFQYVIQLGTYPGASGGTGTFNISISGGNAADDCSAPITIAGPGTIAFDTAGATTGSYGQGASACDFFGTTGIGNDIWYRWFAPTMGHARITTCGGASLDTKLAVHLGFCPVGSALACDDDTCSVQSDVEWNTRPGWYLIQLGSYPGAGTGSGTFTLTFASADQCATPMPYAGLDSFDVAGLTTGTQGQGEALCFNAGTSGIANDWWIEYVATQTGIAVFSGTLSPSINGDTRAAVYLGAGCPTGPAVACNDNEYSYPEAIVSWAATAGQTYTIQFGQTPGTLPPGPDQFYIAISQESLCYLQLVMSGAQETPPTPSSATGKGCMVLNRTTHVLSYSIEFSGLTSAQTQAHIHGFAPPGVPAGILFSLPLGSPATGTVVLTPAQETSFLDNLAYVNIHTTTFGGGEIRGQLVYASQPPPRDYCKGDGGAAACPCGNFVSQGRRAGCRHSLGNGGELRAVGVASVHCESLVLTGSSMPDSSALYFQGVAWNGAGQGAVFGDGLRCVTGAQLRLGTKMNVSGASQYPASGDAPISVRGLVPATGGTRYYQCWYRNAAAYCTASTFNLTQGLQITWLY